MENIKLYINASIDDVKIYVEKLIEVINKRFPKLDEICNKSIEVNKNNNYWNFVYNKLSIYLKYELKSNISSNNISTISFLLFGNINDKNINKSNINIELYEKSIHSNEIINFRNCVVIILIQNYIIFDDIKIKENKDDIINNIIRIIKCLYIKKSIHVIKSLLLKQHHSNIDIFIPVLFYFIYKEYFQNFISFISSSNCDIKPQYKELLISEYASFTYNEIGSMNFSSKIFEIKLSYSLLGENPKEKKVEKFLETIKDKKFKEKLLNIFDKYYYEKYVRKEQDDKNEKLVKVLNEVQYIKKNIKELKNNLDELKDMQKNYMDDIFRILNIINK